MKNQQLPASTALPAELSVPGVAAALEVNISADLASVHVMHHGRKVTIMRNQNQSNSVDPEFARTSRTCPPFCIQPCELAPGVKTGFRFELYQKDGLLRRVLDWKLITPGCGAPAATRRL